ncbi:MAG TPA: M56 family metallopeptidase [Verrucomicrobiae bacterium]
MSEFKMTVTYGPETIPAFAPPIVAPPAPKLSISFHGWLLLSWAIVSVALFTWMLSRWIQVMRQVRRACSPAESLMPLLQAAQRLAGWKSHVSVRLTDKVMSPAVCGLFQPVILLPRMLINQLAPEQIRAVLVHELIHLKRGDVFVNCVQALLQVVYWWHPLLWFANARMRRVREEAVDDAVMLALRDDADSYAPTLLEVAKLAFHRPLASLGLVGILESRSALRQRIERLIHFPTPRRAGLSMVSLLAVAAFTAVAVPMGEKPLETKTKIAALNSKTSNPKTEVRTFQLPRSNAFEVVSGNANFDANTRIFTASNRVVLTTAKQVLRADAIELDEDTRKVTARGNVQLTEKQSSPIPATSGRRAIMDKLKNIRLGYIVYESATLSDVVQDLNRQVRERDPEKKGIDFSIRLSSSNLSLIDPKTGRMISDSSRSNEISSTRVTIRPGLIEPTLHEVLKAIVKSADRPLHYSISESGIAIVPETADGPRLHMRTFKVDTGAFIQNLKSTGVIAPEINVSIQSDEDRVAVQAGMLKWFTKLGIDFSPETGKNVFWNPGNGTMLVRAETADLDIIEHAITWRNQPPSPQINIKARFVELPEENLGEFLKSLVVTNSITGNITTTLSSVQMKNALETINKRNYAVLRNGGEVTTLLGRQARLEVVDLNTFPTKINPKALTVPGVFTSNGTNDLLIAENVPLGTILDVVGYTLPDEKSLALKLTASMTEFLGYEGVGQTPAYLDGKKIFPTMPKPHFRKQEVSSEIVIQDSETVLLTGDKSRETNLAIGTKEPAKRLLVFVTATLIDAAGNRINP